MAWPLQRFFILYDQIEQIERWKRGEVSGPEAALRNILNG